jgi:hypothetical protein
MKIIIRCELDLKESLGFSSGSAQREVTEDVWGKLLIPQEMKGREEEQDEARDRPQQCLCRSDSVIQQRTNDLNKKICRNQRIYPKDVQNALFFS